MKALAIVSRDLEKPSTKYRICQYLPKLEKKGVDVEFIKRTTIDAETIKKIEDYDLIFNQKCLFRNALAKKILKKSKRTIFDFDDAIYLRPGKPHWMITSLRVKRRLHFWLECADVVTVPNQVLAHYAQKYSSSVVILPMALDLSVWVPREKKNRNEIIIGWTGAPVNIPNLERINSILVKVLNSFPNLKLMVHSGQKPNLTCSFEFVPYTSGSEQQFVQNLDIGLLPLTYEEYSMGKSPIKALQYLACGVPVVGNILGATAEILQEENSVAVANEKEWLQGIESLVKDPDLRSKLGKNGRSFVEENHNGIEMAKRLNNLFFKN